MSESCTSYPTSNFTEIPMQSSLSGMDLFCSSNVLLDGKLLTAGGTSSVTGSFGENETRLFTPGTGSAAGSWTDAGDMADWRWYPTSVALSDGRVLTLSGSRHRHHRLFGGRRNGSLPSQAVADSVYRFAPVEDGALDPSVVPLTDGGQKPDVRQSHTFVEMDLTLGFADQQALFGGRGSNGGTVNDTWLLKRNANVLQGDYQYAWDKLEFAGGTPPERREHAAVAIADGDHLGFNMMVVFGGVNDGGDPQVDVRRLFRNGSSYQWAEVTVTGTPPPHFAHAALYDRTIRAAGDTLRRLIVFGGAADTTSAAPTDVRVWEMRFNASDPANGAWSNPPVANLGSPRPAPRRGHALIHDVDYDVIGPRTKVLGDSARTGHVAFLYGGDLGGGVYSDSLWALWLLTDGRVGWELRSFGGSSKPGPRAHHALTFDSGQGDRDGRLYLFGGERAAGTPADSFYYKVDPWQTSPAPVWEQWKNAGYTLANHSMISDLDITIARVAEIYKPEGAGSGWSAHPNAKLLQPTYPPTFLVPGAGGDSSRVVSLGADGWAFWNTVPSAGSMGAWSRHQDIGFLAETGVSYAPGKILLAGGRRGGTVVKTCKTLDATSMNNAWQTVDSLDLRFFHNVVLLPTGQVAAVGGIGSTSTGATIPAKKRPQIWTPATGQWTSPTALAQQTGIRNYHSSSLLLPDARIISASGENHPDKYSAEIFCPPYLFEPGTSTLAARPVIDQAPLRAVWGDTVTVCVPDTAGIRRACLIRPGATTHTFDENQRYVPLSFVQAGSPMRLFVTTPASPDSAPPGAYLLFLTGKGNAPDVPSVARWLYVGGAAGRDTCDTIWPATIADLGPDLISSCSIYLTWTETGDDTTLVASGRVSSNDLRRWTGPINSESAWQQATQLSEAGPVLAGTAQSHQDSGLQPCTNYYYALRVDDDNVHLSGIHPEVKIKTLCGSCSGGGGPESALDEVESAGSSSRRGTRIGLSPQQVSAPAAGALTIESEPLEGGGWRVILRSLSQLDGADANQVLLQAKDAGGAWETRGTIEPAAADELLGVCAPRQAGRRIFPGSYEVQEIGPTLRSASGPLALAGAQHSSAGDILPAVWGGNGAVSLTPGQTLELVYEPSDLTTPPTEDWFALLQRNDQASPTRDGVAEELDLPKQFALYQNQPNPFRGITTIRFDLPKPSPVRLTIYDIAGRKVRTLTRSDWPAGRHSLEWDHRSDAGVQLGAGAYIYRLTTDEFRSEKKMILLAR